MQAFGVLLNYQKVFEYTESLLEHNFMHILLVFNEIILIVVLKFNTKYLFLSTNSCLLISM